MTIALASTQMDASILQRATMTKTHSAITARVLTQVATMPQRVTSIQMLLVTTVHVSSSLTALELAVAASWRMHVAIAMTQML